MKLYFWIVLLCFDVALAADVILGKFSQLTWTGEGTTRIATFTTTTTTTTTTTQPFPESYIHWKMLNETISTNVEDLSTNNFDGILKVIAGDTTRYIEPLYSKESPSTNFGSYYFNPSANINYPFIFYPSNSVLDMASVNFSVGCWVRMNKTFAASRYPTIIGKVRVGELGWGLNVDGDGTDWFSAWYTGANSASLFGTRSVTEWKHLCFTYETGAKQLLSYEDGILKATKSVAAEMVASTNIFTIGSQNVGLSFPLGAFVTQPYVTLSTLTSNQVYDWYDTKTTPTNVATLAYNFTQDVYRLDDTGTNRLFFGLNTFKNQAAASMPIFTNGAWRFDGVDDFMEARYDTNTVTTALTVSIWYNALAYSSLGYIFGIGQAWASNDIAVRIGGTYNETTLPTNSIGILNGSGQYSSTIAQVIPAADTGVWHNVTITFNSTNIPTVAIYLDSTNQSMASTNFVAPLTTRTTFLVGTMPSKVSYWNGYIGDVRVDNKTWSEAEVSSNYLAGRLTQ